MAHDQKKNVSRLLFDSDRFSPEERNRIEKFNEIKIDIVLSFTSQYGTEGFFLFLLRRN